MSESTMIYWTIKDKKFTRELLEKAIKFLLENGFYYNVHLRGMCVVVKKNKPHFHEEKELSKDSYERVDKAIDFLYKHRRGHIILSFKFNECIFEISFFLHPKPKHGKGSTKDLTIGFIFKYYWRHWEDACPGFKEAFFKVIQKMMSYLEEEFGVKFTGYGEDRI